MQKVFAKEGFSLIDYDMIKKLEKGYIVSSSTAENVFVIYRFNRLSETPQGFKVIQKDKEVFFGKQEKGNLQVKKINGLELFIPNYLLKNQFYLYSNELKADINEQLFFEYRTKKNIDINHLVSENKTEIIQKYIRDCCFNEEELRKHYENLLKEFKIQGIVQTRKKTVESVYKKLVARNYSLSELEKVRDINGIRIVVNDIETCYKLLELKSNKGNKNPLSFTNDGVLYEFMLTHDFVARPKPNGYQHLRLEDSSLKAIEIQIQTKGMYDFALNTGYH